MSVDLKEYKAPILAGIVATVTGTLASTGIVLAGLAGVGATPSQAASGICAMLISYGLLSMALSWRYRMPISIVWSTPGAALLASASSLSIGFASAVGAFIVCGILLALTGLWPALGRLVSSIPRSLASAMLAGVIFSFCVSPFLALVDYPTVAIPVIITWIVMYRLAPIWASPVAIVLAFVLIVLTIGIEVDSSALAPRIEFINPQFDIQAMISIAIPLYIVTMASQNVPGIAIMKNFGFDIPFKATLLSTGLVTSVSAFFGGYAQNLAAITAALNADEHAHKDPTKRWVASFSGGVAYLVVAGAASATVAFVLATPRELLLAAAGLALMGTLANALGTAMETLPERIPALITFLITASGIVIFDVGSAFWALVIGLASLKVLQFKR
jgi:benzoate membrane transport protein